MPSDMVFFWHDAKLLAKEAAAGQYILPTVGEISAPPELIYLFSIDSQRFFLAEEESADDYSELREAGYEDTAFFALRGSSPSYLGFAAATAYQLKRWYENNRYCGHCGARMKHSADERMRYCEECHNVVYPKICPAVIVGVISGERIILTKYAGAANSPRYALIAGFAEIGETIEQTVAREVKEEVGIDTENFVYYKCQPWSYSDTLLFGFFCEAKNEDITCDMHELSAAVWGDRDELPEDNEHISLTSEMMAYFKHNGADVCLKRNNSKEN